MYLSVSYSLSIAQLFWDTAKGATSYSAQAITDQGLTVSCHTNDTYCALPGMACGQIYNVTVSASNSACNNSVTTKPYTLMTGQSCEQDVGWDWLERGWEGLVGWFKKQL